MFLQAPAGLSLAYPKEDPFSEGEDEPHVTLETLHQSEQPQPLLMVGRFSPQHVLTGKHLPRESISATTVQEKKSINSFSFLF